MNRGGARSEHPAVAHSGAINVPPAPDERVAWLVLASADGVGAATFSQLLQAYGSAVEVLDRAQRGAIEPEQLGLDRDAAAAASDRDRVPLGVRIRAAVRRAEETLAELAELGVGTVTLLDPGYPARLRVLDHRPPVLYWLGNEEVLSGERAVAVVGTRRPSAAGRVLAARIACAFVSAHAVVVSGLAVGIDGAAHAATVERGGRTVAVIGGGHRYAGPRAHRALQAAIVDAGGAVVSELPPGRAPTRGSFPRRNRLISALADAVVVVEAPERSGALITARHALEQGRPLFVAPGRPHEYLTRGCLALLRESDARPVVGPAELLLDLGYETHPVAAAPERTPVAARGRAPSSLAAVGSAERAVAEALAQAAGSPDAIVARTALSPAVVASALVLLQMRGLAQVTGGIYLPAGELLASRTPRSRRDR